MADTVKDFLASLGWNTDPAGQRQFESAIESATLKARLLADGLEELARKVVDSVSNVAISFDQLFFQAQRTNTAASTLTDFVQIMGQAGVSAGEANAAVEAMAAKLRAGEISVQELNRVGWGINPLTGKLDVIQQYMTALTGQADAMTHAYAARVGMSDNVVFAEKRIGAAYEEQKAKLVNFRNALGFDPAKAAEDAKAYMTQWRDTQNKLQAISDDIWSSLTKALTGPMKAFNEFLTINAPAIGEAIKTLTGAFGDMVKAWAADFEKWVQDPRSMTDLRLNMHEFAGEVTVLGAAFHGFVADLVWLIDHAGRLADILNRLVDIKGTQAANQQATTEGLEAEGGVVKGWWSRNMPTWLGGGGGGGGGGATGSGGTVAKGALAAHQKEAYQAALDEGLSPTAARAVVANLSGESLTNPADKHWDGKHYSQGVASWDDERSAAIKAQFGKFPQDMTIPEQMKAHVWEMRTNPRFAATWEALKGTDADAMLGALVHNYEGSANQPADIAKRTGFYNGLGGLGAPAPGPAPAPGSTLSNDYGDLRMTPDAATGGPASGGIIALAHHIQDSQENVERFHAFSDRSHQPGGAHANPGSFHNRGLAFDVSTRGGDYDGARARTRAYLTGLGLTEGANGTGGDFWIEPGTQDHLHVQFNSEASAQRYQQLTAPPPVAAASPWGALTNPFASTASASPLWHGGGQPMTLGGAAPEGAGDTTVHAPMDTKIIVHGSGETSPSAHMVGSGITQKPADLTRNLQGATF